MHKKGFTIVELLAVIVVLSLLAILVYPNIIKVMGSSKDKLKDINIKQIEDGVNTLIDEVLTCDLSGEAKIIFDNTNCVSIKYKLIAEEYEISIDELYENNILSSDSKNCNGTIKLKLDNNYRVIYNTENITCNL